MILQVIYIVIYCIVLFVGFIGNSLVLISVYKYKKLKTPVYILLSNLALADLLLMLLSTMIFIQFLLNQWIFHDVICRIHGALIETAYTASVLTLVGISMERNNAICHPFRTRKNNATILKYSGLIWLISLSVCSFLFYGYHVTNNKNDSCDCLNNF